MRSVAQRIPQPYLQAIFKYAPLVEGVARRYGINGRQLLARLTQGESHFDMGAVSSAGARGATQFMPGTRQDYIRRFHIDPWRSPDEAIHAAAIYLRTAHNVGAYNPGMASYTSYVLGQHVGNLAAQARSAGLHPSRGTSGPSAAPQTVQTGGSGLASLIAELQSQPQRPMGSLLQAPAYSATRYMAQGPQGPQPVYPAKAQQQGSLSDLLSAIDAGQSTQTVKAPAVQPAVNGGPSASGRYPLGRVGKIIGTPFAGTHAKAFNVQGGSDNWQSENAVDISIPIGTPVYAVADGVLGNTGSLGQGGRFAGLRTNLIGKNNAWYYAHMARLAPGIHAGAHVHKGQLLGYSGAANGVAHLHFAQEKGDPRRSLR